jgi:hypothetical protein
MFDFVLWLLLLKGDQLGLMMGSFGMTNPCGRPRVIEAGG